MNGGLRGTLAALPLALGLGANAVLSPDAEYPNVPDHGVAVVMRPAALWSGPSASAIRLGSVPEGSLVRLLGAVRTGYARVQTQEEEVGWVTTRRLRTIDEEEVHEPSPPPTRPPATSGARVSPAALPALRVIAGAFDGCAAEGNPNPTGPRYQQLILNNREKNRHQEPADSDVDANVTLARILAPTSDDSQRWSSAQAAEIEGYVYHVKPGGVETVNCKKSDPEHRDSHIEITPSAEDTGPTRRFIIETTPRFARAVTSVGWDWSTKALQQEIEGKCVRVRGWLFYDSEHANQSENTRPGNESNWRATAWELHPVTRMTVVPCH